VVLSGQETFDSKKNLGITLLRKLLQEKKLYSYNKGELNHIACFDYKIFNKVLSAINTIKTLSGKSIVGSWGTASNFDQKSL